MSRVIILTVIVICCSCIFTAAQNSCGDCLILTPFIKNGKVSEARNLSEVNSSQYFGLQSYAGFMTVKEEYNSNLFFWFFPAATSLSKTPWIIWLQGGPGYSSLYGLFDIVGPIQVKNGKLEPRNLSWTSDYSMVFLDNPVGAGFSFTDDEEGYPNNEDDVGEQMLEFLVQFLEMFPELRSAPLFIVGQSYAGKYIPALGIQIHRYNMKNKHPINFKGIAMGNALIDLREIMHYSTLCETLGILDGQEIDHVKDLEEEVVRLIDENKLVDAANKFNETIEYIKKRSGVSVYNFLKDSTKGAPEFEEYINRHEVRDQIHVGNASFDFNNQLVYYKMLPDFANTTKPFVEELLEHYGVMCYSGQLDIILGYSLSKYMHSTLQWSRRDSFAIAPRHRLRRSANGSVVGYRKAGGNFVEVLVRGAGHAVPVEQPEVAKFIIDSFIEEYRDKNTY